MAKRVQDAIENNIRRWNVSGRLPLDPSDLSDTEAFLLAAHGVGPRTAIPDDPETAFDEPARPEPKPMPKIDLSQFKSGENIPLDLALQAVEDEADPVDVDEYARATEPIISQTLSKMKAWQPL